MVMQKLTREDKARLLIANGAVTLRPGTGTALVRGSNGETYTVTREACTCPDFQARGVDCKHRLGTRILCQEYRACAAQARRGETVRPSVALLKAIGWEVGEQSPVPVCHHGDPAPCHWCREEAFERQQRENCHSCGARLTPDGYCPREASERLERMAA